jgi:hypothetical protein
MPHLVTLELIFTHPLLQKRAQSFLLFDLLLGARGSLTGHVLGDVVAIALAIAVLISSAALLRAPSATDDTSSTPSGSTGSRTARARFLGGFSRSLSLGLSTSLLLTRRAAGHAPAHETHSVDTRRTLVCR